jgi:hypothetical protein
MSSSKQLEPLSIKDAYTLYEEGKKRRYSLLFSVNGGAFAIAKLLTSSAANVLGDLSLAHLAIGMGIFTILMTWDIYAFGEKMRDRHLGEEVRSPDLVADLVGCVINAPNPEK